MQREPDCDYAVQLVAERFNLGRPDAQKAFREFVGRMNQAYFPPITKMELIHTEGCNLACDYCFEKNMIGYRRMKPEVGEAAIDLLLEYSQGEPELTITHFGGEPMVNFPAVRRMTEYAERRAAETDKRIHFSMTSNGVLFNRSRARYCADHGIMVLLSVDGLKDSHDRFRRDRKGRGTFDAVMRGMSYLKETQRWIGVKLTVMPHNARSLLADVVGLRELGVNQFVIGYATGIQWSDGDMDVFSAQMAEVKSWYTENQAENLRITEFDDPRPATELGFGCQAGNNSITVAVDGEVSPCSKVLALDSKNLVLKLGDVTHGLTHLANRADICGAAELRKAWAQSFADQEYLGGCWATNVTDEGDPFVPSTQDQVFKGKQAAACAGCSSCK